MVTDVLSWSFIDTLMVDYLHDEIADMVDDMEPGKRIAEYVALAEKVKSLSTGEKYAILEKMKQWLVQYESLLNSTILYFLPTVDHHEWSVGNILNGVIPFWRETIIIGIRVAIKESEIKKYQ